MGENKGGRPQVTLSSDQMVLVEKLSGVLTVTQLADLLGIARSTFYEIIDRDEAVFGLYKKGRAGAISDVAQNLVQRALDGDNAAMIFYLKTQAGWKETQTVEHVEKITDSGGEEW